MLSFKVLKELSCSCNIMFNHLKKVNVDFFSVTDFYLFCKKSNRRLVFNDTVFFWVICQYKGGEEWLQGRCFLLNITLIDPIFS